MPETLSHPYAATCFIHSLSLLLLSYAFIKNLNDSFYTAK